MNYLKTKNKYKNFLFTYPHVITEISPATKLVEKEKNISCPVNNIIEDSNLTEEEILEILHSLPYKLKVVYHLYTINNYNHKKIAALLKISILTSKIRLTTARKLLREKMYQHALTWII